MAKNERRFLADILRESAGYFWKLWDEASSERGDRYQAKICIPSLDNEEGYKHLYVASTAAFILYSLGKEELLLLEQQRTIHSFTVSGSSLLTASEAITRHLTNQADYHFCRDELEQLQRTCNLAANYVALLGVTFSYTPYLAPKLPSHSAARTPEESF